MQNKKIILALILLVIGLGAAAGVYTFFTKNQEAPFGTDPDLSFYRGLLVSNQDFALGEGYYKSGNYENAITSYEAALNNVNNPAEDAQIRYKLALAYRYNNEPFQAIPILKAVASNPDYPPTTRAYAVQAMGQAYYSFNDPSLTEEIFKDGPYKEMYIAEDKELSYRRLFEYASAFYPLGISESRIAYWYAEQMVKDKNAGLQMNEEHLKTISTKLTNADADVQRTRNNPDRGATYIPEILNRRAQILGLVSIAGNESLGNPETAFEEALREAKGSIAYEAQGRWFYAQYLAMKYGRDRTNEISELLTPFYTTDRYERTGMVRFIKNEKDNNNGKRDRILTVADIDPAFKNYLTVLGWQF